MTGQGKRLLGIGLLVVLFVAGGAVGVAADRLWLRPAPQGVKNDDGEQRDRRWRRGRRVERLTKKFRKRLKLSDAQTKKVHAALLSMRQQIRQIRRKSAPEVRAVREATRAEIRKFLSTAQRKRYEKMVADWKARRRARRRRRDR